MTSPAERPAQRPDMTTVEIDGEAVVYDEATGRLHHLNPSATIVFGLCDGTLTVDEMAAMVSETFGVPLGDVAEQVRTAVRTFAEAGLLT